MSPFSLWVMCSHHPHRSLTHSLNNRLHSVLAAHSLWLLEMFTCFKKSWLISIIVTYVWWLSDVSVLLPCLFNLNLLSVSALYFVKMFFFAFFFCFTLKDFFLFFLLGAQLSCVLTVSVALVSVARMCQFFCFFQSFFRCWCCFLRQNRKRVGIKRHHITIQMQWSVTVVPAPGL